MPFGLTPAYLTIRECKPDGTPTYMSLCLTTSRRLSGNYFPLADEFVRYQWALMGEGKSDKSDESVKSDKSDKS